MKGIILAGGSGIRLSPLTTIINKHLLPVYDKPMIYYSLSILMLVGIKEICLITTDKDRPKFETLLGNGNQLGLNLTYETQSEPNGISEAFIICEKFIGNDKVCLILGDNFFYGQGLSGLLQNTRVNAADGATLFAYHTSHPERYGVFELDKNKNVLSIEEKPTSPKSNYVATGLYFYDNSVIEIAKTLKPSKRGELEITDLNNIYLKMNKLKVEFLYRGVTWMDVGLPKTLIEAGNFVSIIEKHHNLKIACLEEIAYNMGYINIGNLNDLTQKMPNCQYKDYLINFIENI
jgi:glucose-1-phosphate thymidylyltransferase